MTKSIQIATTQLAACNFRRFLAKALLITLAFAVISPGPSRAIAQSRLPRETRYYLLQAMQCLKQGNDYCALKSLQAAARISPQLAHDPDLVRIARILYARVEDGNSSSGQYSAPSWRTPEARRSFVDTFKNPYLN